MMNEKQRWRESTTLAAAMFDFFLAFFLSFVSHRLDPFSHKRIFHTRSIQPRHRTFPNWRRTPSIDVVATILSRTNITKPYWLNGSKKWLRDETILVVTSNWERDERRKTEKRQADARALLREDSPSSLTGTRSSTSRSEERPGRRERGKKRKKEKLFYRPYRIWSLAGKKEGEREEDKRRKKAPKKQTQRNKGSWRERRKKLKMTGLRNDACCRGNATAQQNGKHLQSWTLKSTVPWARALCVFMKSVINKSIIGREWRAGVETNTKEMYNIWRGERKLV